MRVMVFGGMHMRGKSVKTGSAYDMARLYVASELTDKTTDAYMRQGCGFEAAEVECLPEVIMSLRGRSFPAVLNLQTDMVPRAGKLFPVVVAVVEDKARVAA